VELGHGLEGLRSDLILDREDPEDSGVDDDREDRPGKSGPDPGPAQPRFVVAHTELRDEGRAADVNGPSVDAGPSVSSGEGLEVPRRRDLHRTRPKPATTARAGGCGPHNR
jgi:hypothetical protein